MLGADFMAFFADGVLTVQSIQTVTN